MNFIMAGLPNPIMYVFKPYFQLEQRFWIEIISPERDFELLLQDSLKHKLWKCFLRKEIKYPGQISAE